MTKVKYVPGHMAQVQTCYECTSAKENLLWTLLPIVHMVK